MNGWVKITLVPSAFCLIYLFPTSENYLYLPSYLSSNKIRIQRKLFKIYQKGFSVSIKIKTTKLHK
jgi:hypothetical protein